MKDGYPCVFYGDYYGVRGEESPHRKIIEILLDARQNYAYGEQQLVFDDPSIVALIRNGDEENHPGSGLIMVMSNDAGGERLKSHDIRVARAHFCRIFEKKRCAGCVGYDFFVIL